MHLKFLGMATIPNKLIFLFNKECRLWVKSAILASNLLYIQLTIPKHDCSKASVLGSGKFFSVSLFAGLGTELWCLVASQRSLPLSFWMDIFVD